MRKGAQRVLDKRSELTPAANAHATECCTQTRASEAETRDDHLGSKPGCCSWPVALYKRCTANWRL